MSRFSSLNFVRLKIVKGSQTCGFMSKVTELGLEVAHRSADTSLPAPTATENATEQADSKLRKIL